MRKQVEAGVDIVNDGEIPKRGTFSSYIQERLEGIEERSFAVGEGPPPRDVNGRDRKDFPGFFDAGLGGFGSARGPFGGASSQRAAEAQRTLFFCTAPLTYVGRAGAEQDIRNLQAAVQGLDVEPWLPAITPGTVEHWLWNELLQVRRGVPVRHRRRHARGVQAHRRLGRHAAARRPGPAGRLADVPGHERCGLSEVRRSCASRR